MITQAFTEKTNELKQEIAEFGAAATKLVRQNRRTAVGAAVTAGVILGFLLRLVQVDLDKMSTLACVNIRHRYPPQSLSIEIKPAFTETLDMPWPEQER